MEGNGGGASATPWDLGMRWGAPAAASAYPQPHQHFPPPPTEQQQMQQELTCLKLGKRPFCWGGAAARGGDQSHARGNGAGEAAAGELGKRKEKAAPAAAAAAAVPRCQVEGCPATLAVAKDYHRRHKVCEAHSKAPRVVMHGAEQRFCQQCSRFHAISEFDDVKKSCRRRLSGHNERRRKSNASEAMARGSARRHSVSSLVHGFPPYGALPTSPAGALSLLSSVRAGAPWLIPTTDISARSSAALDELIAENRAALLSWHYFADRSATAAAAAWHAPPLTGYTHAHAHDAGHPGHVTLDLMHASAGNTTPAAPAAPAFRAVPDAAAAARTKPGGKDVADDAAACSSDSDVWACARVV